MPENDRLNSCLDDIALDFMEREATPQLLMKLGIQLHLTGLSLSNTVSIPDVFGVERARSTVHIGFIRPIYSPRVGKARITLRLTRL